MPVGVSAYPVALDTASELLTAYNNLGTTLAGAIGATVTTIPVHSTAGFPASDVIVIEGEHITYTGTTATSFTGCTRGAFQAEGGTAAVAHADLAKVELLFTSRHHNALVEAVRALEARVGTGPVGSSLRRDPTTLYLEDHFASGTSVSGQIGQLGWVATGGVISSQVAEPGYPGITRRDTGTTSGTLTSLATRTAAGVLAFAEAFDVRFVLRLNEPDAELRARAGVASAIGSDPPASGTYFEKLGPDTTWFIVTRSGGTETRVNTGVAVSTAWVTLRVRRLSAGSIGFTINANAEQVITTNVPVTGTANVGLHIINVTAVSRTLDIDWFDMNVTGLVR